MSTLDKLVKSYPNVFRKLNASDYMFKYIRNGSEYLLKDNFLVYDSSSNKIGNWVWDNNKLTINFDSLGKVTSWNKSLLSQLEDIFKPPKPKEKPKEKEKKVPTPPKPEPEPEPEPEKTNIVHCDFHPSEGMIFTCNEGCDSPGDTFRRYVNKIFPDIAKQHNLVIKGKKTLDYCNSTIKNVWTHKYDSDESPGLKGVSIGDIYRDKRKPENFVIDCKPWEKDNYFITDYATDIERDDAAMSMVATFNDEHSILDSPMVDQCNNTIDTDLSWAQNNIKDLHKNPMVKWIANSTLNSDKKFYDKWRKNLVKSESVITHLIERKLKIKKKLKIMKENKNIQIVGKVSEKLKTKKFEKITEHFFKQNYRKFFDSYSKYIKSNNMISESTNEDFKKSFDSIFRDKKDEFRERAIKYVINKLEVNPTSTLANEITNELSKIPAEELFTKEYKIPKAVTNAIEKTRQELPSNKTGLEGIFQKSMSFDDEILQQEVRKNLHDYVEDVKDKLINLERKIKSSVIQGL